MRIEDHDQAHRAIDDMVEALLVRPPIGVRLGLFDLRRHLLAHMKAEEHHLVPLLPPEVALAIATDHRDLRQRLGRTETAAVDAAVGALARPRLDDELARLIALLEHHDLREREAYRALSATITWPSLPRSVGDTPPPETEAALARYAWWHRARAEEPADWRPSLPPSFPDTDPALQSVVLRETELLRTWLALAPGRGRLAAAHRLTASLEATVGFTLRRAVRESA